MALPKRKDRKSFDPVVKFNAKEGKFVRCDRVEGENGWETKEHEVAADEFQAIVDLDNIQVGWIAYTTSGPDMRLVGTDEDIGDRPSDAFKEGFRLRMKLRTAPVTTLENCRRQRSGCGIRSTNFIRNSSKDARSTKGNCPWWASLRSLASAPRTA